MTVFTSTGNFLAVTKGIDSPYPKCIIKPAYYIEILF